MASDHLSSYAPQFLISQTQNLNLQFNQEFITHKSIIFYNQCSYQVSLNYYQWFKEKIKE